MSAKPKKVVAKDLEGRLLITKTRKAKMKNIFKILIVLVVAIIGGATLMAGAPLHDMALAMAKPSLAIAPIVLDTQQIVFLNSLKEEYYAIDTWLNEADDLSSFVEKGQTLIFPEAGDFPTVYKNKTDDVDAVEPTETTNSVALDVYDSQNYRIRNINLHALPFDKVAHYTKKSSDAIVKAEIVDAAHAFAAVSASAKCIVLGTTGPVRDGFKMATIDDVITLARACDNAQFPSEGRNLVLPSDMWWDLVNNNDILKGQLQFQQNTGIIEPKIVQYYGFKIHKSIQKLNVGYDVIAATKAAQGTVITGNVVPAGFMFISSVVFRASGMFDMFRVVKNQNTAGRAEEFGFQHRFKADHQMSGRRYSALFYQAKATV